MSAVLVTVVLTISITAVGAAHWYLTRRRQTWPGAVVPVLSLSAAAYAVLTGLLPGTPWTYLVCGFALLTLMSMWGDGREAAAGRWADHP